MQRLEVSGALRPHIWVVRRQTVKMFNDYIRQLHVSAPTGHLQVVFKRT